ncbi:tetratricopeptide repeat protein [Trichocoleus sp. FACHB-262]|uniref:tetratricopeptide repeat protein n=1 Tax=Trichocoleus sp. FACHB-262 TaxID=2692869 RepID=UPI001681C41A|nr:tetratricopeptide repeat protein [Trichocoleus sp. FACHB-262]MBD2121084.1 tetratricopeptide repeat protein [Trichocoleus sp. FACHB-262]
MTSSGIQPFNQPSEADDLTTAPSHLDHAESHTLAEQLGTDPVTTTVAAAVSGGVAGAAIGRLFAGRVGATIGAVVGGIAGAAISNDDSPSTTHAIEGVVSTVKDASEQVKTSATHMADSAQEVAQSSQAKLADTAQTAKQKVQESQAQLTNAARKAAEHLRQQQQSQQATNGSHHFSLEQTYELSAEMHYQIGVALGRQGKLDKAIEEFQEALDLAPDSAETHYNLGVALSKQGDVDQGLDHLQQAEELCLAHGNPKGVRLIKRAIKRIDQSLVSH